MSPKKLFNLRQWIADHNLRRRAATSLLATAVSVSLWGCATSPTSLKTTAGNNTEEIDCISSHVDNPQPEIYPAAYSAAPITSKTLRDGQDITYRDVALSEIMQIAMEHSEVLRELGGTMLRTPEGIKTRYATGLQETDPRFGMAAALSAFDTQFRGAANFNRNDRIVNNKFQASGVNIFAQDAHDYRMELSKRAATGALMTFRSTADMDSNNAPGNTFASAWNSAIEGEIRQPLLAGGGVQFNRIAGPNSVPGIYNGILIARVNTDINQLDFEIALRDLVSNVVNGYWDLYFAYRELNARTHAMNDALESWRKIKAQVEAEGAPAAREALAREQYYRFKSEVDDSLAGRLVQGTQTRNGSTGGTLRATGGVQVCERRLRLLIGLPISDGNLLRPNQDPSEAEVLYDWETIMHESLTRRPELRRQQMRVRRREMELLAAQNYLNPQLDAIGRYRFRGFGDNFIDKGNQGGARPASSVGNLANGSYQEWLLGVEMSMPIGFRQGHAAVANAELQLSHERAIHREQEREVVHDLSNAIADAVRAYEACQNNLNRMLAAKEVLNSLEAEEKSGLPIDIDRVLDAQRRAVEAEIRYVQCLAEYAVAQKNIQLEKGSLLTTNDLVLIDGVGTETETETAPPPITKPSKPSSPVEPEVPALVPPAEQAADNESTILRMSHDEGDEDEFPRREEPSDDSDNEPSTSSDVLDQLVDGPLDKLR